MARIPPVSADPNGADGELATRNRPYPTVSDLVRRCINSASTMTYCWKPCHDSQTSSMCIFSNKKTTSILERGRYWRDHSQSQRIKQLLRDWKPSSDIYQAGHPMPELHREIWFHQALEWVLSKSQRRCGLESLVISGYKFANYERLSVPNLKTLDASTFSDLKHLTLDFRIENGSCLGSWDDRWFRKAVRFMVKSSPHLKTLDIFAPGEQQNLRLGLLSIFDWSLRYAQLQEIQVSFVAFDEEELRLFVDYLKHSLRKLTIKYPRLQPSRSLERLCPV